MGTAYQLCIPEIQLDHLTTLKNLNPYHRTDKGPTGIPGYGTKLT